MTEKQRRTVTLDESNDQFLKNHDNASSLVNRLVKQYREGPGKQTAALEVQIEQKQRELREAKKDLESAESRVTRIEKEIQELRELKTGFERQEQTKLADARETLKDTPKNPENPAIQRWSGELDMTPTQLVEELQ